MLLDVEMDLIWSFLMTTYMTGVRHDIFRAKYLCPDSIPFHARYTITLKYSYPLQAWTSICSGTNYSQIVSPSKHSTLLLLGIATPSKAWNSMFRAKLLPNSFPFQAWYTITLRYSYPIQAWNSMLYVQGHIIHR